MDRGNVDLPWDAYFAIIDGLPCKILEFKFAISCRSGESIAKEEMIQNTAKREKVTDSSRRIQVMPYLYQVPGYGKKATFDRMNFASSTSNITSKKEKGYKRLVVDLLATTDEGRTIIIAKSESVKLVVRSHSKEYYNDKGKEGPSSASNTAASTSPYSYQDPHYYAPSPHNLFPLQSGSNSDLFYQPSPSGSEPFPYRSEGDTIPGNPSSAISDTFQYHPSPDYRGFHSSPTSEYPYHSDHFGFANMSLAPTYPIMEAPLQYQANGYMSNNSGRYVPSEPAYLPSGAPGYLPAPQGTYLQPIDHTCLSNDLAPLAPTYRHPECLPTRERLDAFFEPVHGGYEYPLNVSVPSGAIDSRVDEPNEDEYEDEGDRKQ